MTRQSLLIRDVPNHERPRERLLADGAKYLSNQELLAIILRTGSKDESVLQLAHRVLQKFDGLTMLKDATVEELKEIKGIGEAKAVEVCAVLELGRRITNLKLEERYVIRSPEDVSRYVMEDMRSLTQEHFVCLILIYIRKKNTQKK